MSHDVMDADAIDVLRLKAFKTNKPADRDAYSNAVSRWFQDRHARDMAAEIEVAKLVSEAVAMTDHTVDKAALATGAHFNKLTPAEAERLAMLAEECGEVIQVIGKILRHGYDSFHPADPSVTNRDLLGRELTDLLTVAASLCRGQGARGFPARSG